MSDQENTDHDDELRANYLRRPIDRDAKIAFLKRWGKKIPPDLLTGGLGKRNPDINPVAEPMPPLWKGSVTPRYLACRGVGDSLTLLPIDDEGRCFVQNHINPAWHRYHVYGPYAEARPELLAIRCPQSLTETEWPRVFNSPSDARAWAQKAKKPANKPDYSLED